MFRWCNSTKGRTGGDENRLWDQSLKQHTYGDFSMAVLQTNATLEDQGHVITTPFATFIGIYDGHGGPDAARFVRARLPSLFHKFATSRESVSSDVLRMSFAATEEEFLNFVKSSWKQRPLLATVGTCCLVGTLYKNMLYVANLGDSRGVLARFKNSYRREVVAVRLTFDYNVADENVRTELINQYPEEPDIVVHTEGSWRIKGCIQVSKAIGDVYLKIPEISEDPTLNNNISQVTPLKGSVISAKPDIRSRKLGRLDSFLIFASSGLWQNLSDQEAVEIVSKNPREGIARRLINAARYGRATKTQRSHTGLKGERRRIRREVHDDITVIVAYLDDHIVHPSFELKESKYTVTSAPLDIVSLTNQPH